MTSPPRNVVLCLSGHDPSGGAGVQADIEAIAAQDAHAVSVITAQTVQDSRNVLRVVATPFALLSEQLETLLRDVKPAAIKVGLLADPAQPALIARLARQCAVPVVVDPVLRAGGGTDLATAEALAALKSDLLPATTLLTPNAAEARRMTGLESAADCAAALLALGCANVLITGGDEPGESVVNHWYGAKGTASVHRSHSWPRLPGPFHGAGCTLAAAIAGLLARGEAMDQAIADGQAYTQRALAQAFAPGVGRKIPKRL